MAAEVDPAEASTPKLRGAAALAQLSGGNMIFQSIQKWQIALLIGSIIIILIPISTWRHFHTCNEQGALRMTISVEGNSLETREISGQIMGAGAGKYRAQGYKVILYAKTDIWYNEPTEGAEIRLESDCSWRVEGVHDGHRYAAFLVPKAYQQPGAINKTDPTDYPPLTVDGKQIVAWMPWSPDSSRLTPAGGPKELALNWLIQQVTPNEIVPNPPADRAGFIISYHIPTSDEPHDFLFSRSWIYDNALAIISLVANGNIVEPRKIINALKGQIVEDGKFGFSYNTANDWYHEDYRSGAIAWLGYAFVFYQQETGDAQSQAVTEGIARYLLSLQNVNRASPSYGSIRDGPEVDWYSTEHNIIAYFFLRDLGRLTGNEVYITGAELVKASLLNYHWNEALGRFDLGDDGPANVLIDVPSLGALFLVAVGDTARARSNLEFVEQTYQNSQQAPGIGPVTGYAPYEDQSVVWSQGSLEIALAYKRIGDVAKSRTITEEIIKLQNSGGGVPYAMPQATVITEDVFYEWPSVAGTGWLVIVLSDDGRFLGP